jgi:HAD superfamily hydrolase (TIGR01549 family)
VATQTGPVPVILFDLDNTLYDRSAAYRLWAHGFVRRHALEPSEVDWLCAADGDGFVSRPEVWDRTRERFGLERSVEGLIANYHADFLEVLTPDETIQGALGSLTDAGWRIGIVTNGPDLFHRHKAEALGILPLVQAFCASEAVGFAKPDPRIFRAAIAAAAATPTVRDLEARWMVGDHPEADIAGGRALGLRTAWIRRNRTWDPRDGDAPSLVADHAVEVIDTLLEATI